MTPIPDALRRSSPRPVRLSTVGMIVAAVAFVIALAAPVIAVALYTKATLDADRAVLRASQGTKTEGRVTEIQLRNSDKSRSIVRYTFDVSGEPHDGQFRVRRRDVKSMGLAVGSPLRIGYLPEKPSDNWVVGREPGGGHFWMAPVASCVALAIAALIFMQIRRQRHLLAYGRAAVAVATGSKRIRHQHGQTDQVLFEFQNLNGAMRKGSATVSKVPPVGSEFIVIYDPDRPQRVAMYPLSLATADRAF